MATVTLTKIGTAVGGPVGGFVGAIVGSVVDTYIQNQLFPAGDPSGPRLDSIELSSASEGSDVNVAFGNEAYVRGSIIWHSQLRSETVEGSKGGPKPDMHEIFVDIAIEWCDASIHGIDGIAAIEEIWIDGELFYDDEPDVDLTASDITATRIELFENPDFLATPTNVRLEITSPNGSVDLSLLRPGRDATVSGWTDTNNNGTFRVLTSEKDLVSGISKAALVNPLAADESAGASVNVFQDLPQFEPDAADSVTNYLGSWTQGTDPTIDAGSPSATTPNYRGFAYTVIAGMELAKNYGGAPPRIFEAKLRTESGTVTVAGVIGKLMDRAGFGSSEYDASGLTEELRSMVLRGPVSTLDALGQLFIRYRLFAFRDNGVMRFRKLSAADVVSDIDEEVLASRELGTEGPRPLLQHDRESLDLPRAMEMVYRDVDNHGQSGAQRYVRNQGETRRVSPIRLDIGLTGEEAQCILREMMWTAEVGRRKIEFELPPSRGDVVEGDVLLLPVSGQTERVQVEEVAVGLNGVLRGRGKIQQTHTLSIPLSECQAEDPEAIAAILYFPPELSFLAIDLPPLLDAHANSVGYYWAGAAEDGKATFLGAGNYESEDGGSAFTLVGSTPFEAGVGRAETQLGDAIPGLLDRSNTLDLELFHAELASTTLSNLLKGANRLWLGRVLSGVTTGEIIGFQTATLLETTDRNTRRYRLSNLLRGLGNTEEETSRHAPNDRVLVLTNVGAQFRELSLGQVGSALDVRVVPDGMAVADVTSQDLTVAGNSSRPFSPVRIRGTASGSDLVISWERRTRSPGYLTIAGGSLPQFEASLSYEVDILDSPGGTVLRTLAVTGSESVTYDAADLATDGFSSGDPIDVEVFQTSPVAGRSRAKVAVLTAP